jgi:hypothetical protein
MVRASIVPPIEVCARRIGNVVGSASRSLCFGFSDRLTWADIRVQS